ncbi:hypothetical protein J6590_013892 [Homalodisca vitripennis]|nr:hypothetical protein J6590_013892 [Homalodisca vitripennis]
MARKYKKHDGKHAETASANAEVVKFAIDDQNESFEDKVDEILREALYCRTVSLPYSWKEDRSYVTFDTGTRVTGHGNTIRHEHSSLASGYGSVELQLLGEPQAMCERGYAICLYRAPPLIN